MNFDKTIIDNMERCYSVGYAQIDGRDCALVASEAINGELAYYDLDDSYKKNVIWNDIGGTMSIIEVPDTTNTFYVGTKFYPGFNSKESGVYCVKKENNQWKRYEVLSLPYLHRFDIFLVNNKRIFVGCTLCTSKENKEDWSDPGKVYVGYLNDDVTKTFEVKEIKNNLLKNHGYYRSCLNGEDVGYITSDNGIYKFVPNEDLDKCSINKVLDGHISDMVICDVDNCGIPEIVTIEPFHGNQLKIYKNIDNEYKQIYSFPYEIEFAHALWAGELCGKKTIVLGTRKLEKKLFTIQYINGEFVVETQDENNGSANVCVFNRKDSDYVLSANNAIGEVALYHVK